MIRKDKTSIILLSLIFILRKTKESSVPSINEEFYYENI